MTRLSTASSNSPEIAANGQELSRLAHNVLSRLAAGSGTRAGDRVGTAGQPLMVIGGYYGNEACHLYYCLCEECC